MKMSYVDKLLQSSQQQQQQLQHDAVPTALTTALKISDMFMEARPHSFVDICAAQVGRVFLGSSPRLCSTCQRLSHVLCRSSRWWTTRLLRRTGRWSS